MLEPSHPHLAVAVELGPLRQPDRDHAADDVRHGPLLFVVQLAWALRQLQGAPLPSRASQPSSDVETIGVKLFTDYAFAFEATSVLILVAMVGAIVLAKKEKG